MKRFYLIIVAVIFAGFLFGIFNLVLAEDQTCSDSDETDYYRKGVITICETIDEEEVCTNTLDSCSGNILTEYYCNDDQIASETYTCPNECKDSRCLHGINCWSDDDCYPDEFCEFNGCFADKGRCVDVASVCSSVYDPNCGCDGKTYNNSCLRRKVKISLDHIGRCGDSCTDSDVGQNFHIKGNIDGYDNQGNHIKKTDSCSKGILKEYYCDNSDFASYISYKCPQGCSKGACKIVEDLIPAPTSGCMDPNAKNYNADATRDNSSCIYSIPPVINNEESDEELTDELNFNVEPEVHTASKGSFYERIKHLGYEISEKERQVINQEKDNFIGFDSDLINSLKGRILLQIQNNGEAWYVDPDTTKKFYLKDGQSAYLALNAFGLGISNDNLAKIPIGIEERISVTDSDGDGLDDNLEKALGTDFNNSDSDGDGYLDGEEIKNNYSPVKTLREKINIDSSLVNRLAGKILLQVQSYGEAWYVNPTDGKRYYMKDGEQAYQIMRFLSLGITNDDLRKIPVGEFE